MLKKNNVSTNKMLSIPIIIYKLGVGALISMKVMHMYVNFSIIFFRLKKLSMV